MNGNFNHLIRELDTRQLTRAELAVVVETTFYFMDSNLRGKIGARIPDIYNRLLGANWELGAPRPTEATSDAS